MDSQLIPFFSSFCLWPEPASDQGLGDSLGLWGNGPGRERAVGRDTGSSWSQRGHWVAMQRVRPRAVDAGLLTRKPTKEEGKWRAGSWPHVGRISPGRLSKKQEV